MIPVRYIRLEPLESWGSNFNYSLWYVELHGIDNPHIMSMEVAKFHQVRFKVIYCHCCRVITVSPVCVISTVKKC